jgi:hypothetical protein
MSPHRIRSRALAVIAAAALLTLALGVGVASAGQDARNAETTFTKWITLVPAVPPAIRNMAGFVGGDVGDGTFTGEVLSAVVDMSTTPPTKTLDAVYHFSGSTHSFNADVHVIQTGLVNGSTAVITGFVTSGWLKGNHVAGEYTQIACVEGPLGYCFQGTLDILRGSKSDD